MSKMVDEHKHTCHYLSTILLGTIYWPSFSQNPNNFIGIAIVWISDFFSFIICHNFVIVDHQNLKYCAIQSSLLLLHWYCTFAYWNLVKEHSITSTPDYLEINKNTTKVIYQSSFWWLFAWYLWVIFVWYCKPDSLVLLLVDFGYKYTKFCLILLLYLSVKRVFCYCLILSQ